MPKTKHTSTEPIRLGFVPLVDCAPLAVARELQLFQRHGIEVTLHREIGWATIRDKIIYGELDAAQAPAGLMVATSCGLNCAQTECLTGLILNAHGNAITLSQELWRQGVRDAKSLRRAVHFSDRLFTFGVAHNFASHGFLMREWLRNAGIKPDEDVQIVVVPPPQMPANLKSGHIDGFCVGEPWNSVATSARTGWTVATSIELAARHPEKVLMVRRSFAEASEQQHLGIIATLLEACEYCSRPENREELADILSRREYVGTSKQVIQASLSDDFNFGNGRVERHPNIHLFHGHGLNEPTVASANWVIRALQSSASAAGALTIPPSRAAEWFRSDIFAKATQRVTSSTT